MNFLQAVKELSEGRCKGIQQTGWTLGTYFMIGIGRQLWFSDASAAYYLSIDRVLADDWQLVDPTPQTGEVEVVAWKWNYDKPLPHGCTEYTTRPPHMGVLDGYIKLTGHITRPVKPKVKRRENIPCPFGYEQMKPMPKFYAEWEE